MFVDCVEIFVSSGKGGEGAVSFRREKFVLNGGPDGGNGGKGGSIYFRVDRNTDTLSHFRGHKHFKAQNGQPGLGGNKYGKKGKDLVIAVPPGTQVYDTQSGELLLDLVEESGKILFLEGGKGGLGNVHFKNAINQRPTYAQKGLAGISKNIRLELKLIADVGLVGFPNVGKSTLISVLSHAKPEIADYEFTTLVPSLGIVPIGDYYSFVMADIPGIIGGASEGKGLGIQFLRHIERTKFLLFVLDMVNYRSLNEQFNTLKSELENFSLILSCKPYGIMLSKSDARVDKKEALEEFLRVMNFNFKKHSTTPLCFINENLTSKNEPLFVIAASSVQKENSEALKYLLYEAIKGIK